LSQQSDPNRDQPNARRALVKMLGVAALLGGVLVALITFVDEETFHDLRHHLTLWLIIAIVVIINIVSFLLFIIFWAIYRWIKRDLEPVEED
jgi:uncharacterized BrkB/YihY/UPF0761 family membrane protein